MPIRLTPSTGLQVKTKPQNDGVFVQFLLADVYIYILYVYNVYIYIMYDIRRGGSIHCKPYQSFLKLPKLSSHLRIELKYHGESLNNQCVRRC